MRVHNGAWYNKIVCLYYMYWQGDVKCFVCVVYFLFWKFDTEIFFCYNRNVNRLLYLELLAMIREHLSTKNSSGLGNTKEYIVLHHTGTGEGSLSGVLRRLQHGTVSAHYVIDTDGSIYAFNSDDDILRHAGPSSWEGKTNLNQYSIGIEMIGPLPWFTDAQRKSLRSLVLNLMQKYSIPSTHIIRHKDIAPRRKVDPDDSLWAVAFPSFAAYQESYAVVQLAMGFYESVYKKEFAQQLQSWDTVIQDIDSVVQRVTNPDGSININELVYFIGIALEKVKKQKIESIH